MVRRAGFQVERLMLPGNTFWLRRSAETSRRLRAAGQVAALDVEPFPFASSGQLAGVDAAIRRDGFDCAKTVNKRFRKMDLRVRLQKR